MNKPERIVKQEEVQQPDGRIAEVSTVFTGMDLRCEGSGPPLLFETRVFVEEDSIECVHCSTWVEAEAQHAAMVEKVRRGC